MAYCECCTCPDCLGVRVAILEKERLQQEAQERMDAKRAAHEAEHERKRSLILGEQAVLWMLVNTAPTINDAQHLMVYLSEVLDYRTAQVNAKRQRYAAELQDRAENMKSNESWWRRLRDAGAIGDSFLHPHNWFKIPGSRGTDMPPETWPKTGRKRNFK